MSALQDRRHNAHWHRHHRRSINIRRPPQIHLSCGQIWGIKFWINTIQYNVSILNTHSQLDSLVSNDELYIMHTERSTCARSKYGRALQAASWEQWNKEGSKISSHNCKLGRCQYDCNFEDNSCKIQTQHTKSRANISQSCGSPSSHIPVICVLHSWPKFQWLEVKNAVRGFWRICK